MNFSSDSTSLKFNNEYSDYLLIASYVCLILLYLFPYSSRLTIPHADFLNVMEVINYLNAPELFGNDSLLQSHTNSHTTTAPVYYYGICLPLSYLLPSKWVLLSVGAFLSLACAFLSRDYFRRGNYWLSLPVLFVLLNVYLSPLEGNRRSFTAFFLLGGISIWKNSTYYWKLFFVALAAGTYPPAALILIVYSVLIGFREVRNSDCSTTKLCLEHTGIVAVVLIVLSPYLANLTTTSEHYFTSLPLTYELSSIQGLFKSFLVGSDLSDRGVLFRESSHYLLFFGVLVLLFLEGLILGKNFRLKSSPLLLVLGSIFLWGLAHLAHPLIYQPVKYTRLTLPLMGSLIFLSNLPPTTRRVRNAFSNRNLGRYAIDFLAILLVTLLSVTYFNVAGGLDLSSDWIKFCLSIPLALIIMTFAPGTVKQTLVRSVLISVLLFGSLLLPHRAEPEYYALENLKTYELDFHLSDLSGLYKFLRSTPPGTRIAGPPHLLTGIPAFGNRSVYLTARRADVTRVCERYSEVWKHYFSGNTREISMFMETNDIDLFLVDKKYFDLSWFIGDLRCLDTLSVARKPVLERATPKAVWNKENRYYLLDRSTIASTPPTPSDTLEVGKENRATGRRNKVPIRIVY